MAGKPGMKGGGGARAGAGRKPKPKAKIERVVIKSADRDTLKLLEDVAFGLIDASPLQVRAAIAAVQYTHTKRSDGGKKDEAADKAKKAASKFAPTAAPLKLVR